MNQNFAGKPTPAGQALITANLFTPAQLTALGAVMPQVSPAPANQAGDSWLRALDFSLNWTYKVKERVAIQPGVTFFNVMNFVNFDAPKNTLSGVLSTVGTPASVGTANGTPGEQLNNLRVGLGSGVFGLGSPRVIEFNLKLLPQLLAEAARVKLPSVFGLAIFSLVPRAWPDSWPSGGVHNSRDAI